MNNYKIHCVVKVGKIYRDHLTHVQSVGSIAEVVASMAELDKRFFDAFFIDGETSAPFIFRTTVKFKDFSSDIELLTLKDVNDYLNDIETDESYISHGSTVAVLLPSFKGRTGDLLKQCGKVEKNHLFSADTLFNN